MVAQQCNKSTSMIILFFPLKGQPATIDPHHVIFGETMRLNYVLHDEEVPFPLKLGENLLRVMKCNAMHPQELP
jgi:hypothetical protein